MIFLRALVVAAVLYTAFALLEYRDAKTWSVIECDTDSDCMQKNGGDGSPTTTKGKVILL